MTTATKFASTLDFDKGGVEVIGHDQARRYLFSNMFEVAARAKPWERIVVAKNLEFTVECARAEGDSPWYICGHDETALVMQGDLSIHFVEVDPVLRPAPTVNGAVTLATSPAGKAMGKTVLGRGHLALLPAGAAYQLRPRSLGVVLFQSTLGASSLERWADICQH